MIENTFFQVLFDDSDYFCSGNLYDTEVRSVFPVETGFQYFTVNPLLRSHNGLETKRSDEFVSSFRNFVFEFDELHLHEQEKLLDQLDIKFSTIVYSGGKSLHAIISLENPLDLPCGDRDSINEYKRIWKSIASYIDSQAYKMGFAGEGVSVVDFSCKNPSRYTRFPNTFRKDKDKLQEVKYIGSRMSHDEFTYLMSKCPVVDPVSFSSASVLLPDQTSDEFEILSRIPIGLKMKIRHFPDAASSGMYDPIYQLVLWIIEEANPTYDACLNLLEKTTFEVMYKVGYPRFKRSPYLAVQHAFKKKFGGGNVKR